MEKKSAAPALERAMDILELVESYEKGLTFSAIQKELKIPKQSLLRLLKVMLSRKYLRQDNKIYSLGLRLLSLGAVVQASLSLREVARPFMEELLKKSGETVELVIFDEDCLLVLDKLENFDSPVRILSKTGGRHHSLHANAGGKVTLAFLPENKGIRWLDGHSLKKNTVFTVTDKAKLKTELERIRKEGIGYDFQESRLEVSRISSPVFSQDGLFAAALNIAGPSFRLDQKSKKKFGNLVLESARRISKELGCKAY